MLRFNLHVISCILDASMISNLRAFVEYEFYPLLFVTLPYPVPRGHI
jgi:hypothetical protein